MYKKCTLHVGFLLLYVLEIALGGEGFVTEILKSNIKVIKIRW